MDTLIGTTSAASRWIGGTMMIAVLIGHGSSSAHTVEITTVLPATERIVSIGSWYEISDGAGWTFRPETDIDHLELARYGPGVSLGVGTTPFEQHRLRSSGTWPDGPENALGELGYEISPGVLGDNNQRLFGKPYYESLVLFGGHLSPDSVYAVSFPDSAPSRLWLHPLRADYFTMSAAILQGSETTLTTPVYGPASVSRSIVTADSTRFRYTGLSPDQATGLKDDYPVGDYAQRPGSHGHGDFGWFSGYSLSFRNEGPGAVGVSLFMTTGFTGPSGAPTNTLANDTFWKSNEVFIPMGDTATVRLAFDNVRGYSLSDNPFPHTAGGESAADGTAGAAINVFDRLQVSAIGWEVRSGTGGPVDADLILTSRASAGPITSVGVGAGTPVSAAGSVRVAPNPFGHRTRVEYTVPRPGDVTILVYDVRGRFVRMLMNGPVVGGTHVASWDARDEGGGRVTSGIYFIRAVASGSSIVRKAVVLR